MNKQNKNAKSKNSKANNSNGDGNENEDDEDNNNVSYDSMIKSNENYDDDVEEDDGLDEDADCCDENADVQVVDSTERDTKHDLKQRGDEPKEANGGGDEYDESVKSSLLHQRMIVNHQEISVLDSTANSITYPSEETSTPSESSSSSIFMTPSSLSGSTELSSLNQNEMSAQQHRQHNATNTTRYISMAKSFFDKIGTKAELKIE